MTDSLFSRWTAVGTVRKALLLATSALVFASVQPASAVTLVEALAEAYESNPDLASAREQLKGTNEEVPQALSNWRPSVSLSGSAGKQIYKNNNSNDSYNNSTPTSGSVTVSQPVYRGGRTVAQTEQAEFQVEAQRARLNSSEQTVLLNGVLAFMNVWRDESVLQLNINNEQVLQRQLEASQDRFQVGEITRTDVAQSESRLAGATAERVQAEGVLESSKATYLEVIGSEPDVLSAPLPLEGLPGSQEEAIGQAATNNPEVLAAQFDERASQSNIRLVQGELYPTVSLDGSFDRDLNQTFSGTQANQGSVIASVSIPVYQQGSVYSRVRQAKYNNNQLRLDKTSVDRRIEQETVTAWEALLTAKAQIRSFESQVTAAAIALDGVTQENQVGSRTVLDVLNAEQELLDAKVALVRAQRDEIVAGFQLLSAVGRLSAYELGLAVDIYDPTVDYEKTRNKWFGLSVNDE